MNSARPPDKAGFLDRLGLNPWLQLFLTIIAGTIVILIAWQVVVEFHHIIILMIASFIFAYLIAPLVNRMERGGVPRLAATGLVYLVVFGVLGLVVLLLLGPLVTQVRGVLDSLPTYFNPKGQRSGVERYLAGHGVDVSKVRDQVFGTLQQASTSILNNTLGIVSGTIATITDFLLVLVITFYFVVDGHAMRNRGVRLLPTLYRDRWFFIEATLNQVLGGYIRGQIIVAATVGLAAGIGSWLLHVNFPIVIGMLTFLFEFIPMLGPVLGMVPAVVISLFQSPTPALWVIIYYIVLQQVESNLIVPRISGHAVGLHPLAALLALIGGLDFGGIGGALLSVPAVGVLYVLVSALYSDTTSHSQMLVGHQRRRSYPYDFLARRINQRRRPGELAQEQVTTTAPNDPTPIVQNERLASIQQDSEQLKEQFEADEARQVEVEQIAPTQPGHERQGPSDAKLPEVRL